MASCAFGPCDRSLEMGGAGCDMCDRVAKLPQPTFKSRGSLVEDEAPSPLALDVEPDFAAAPPAPARRPALTVSRVATSAPKRRAANGPQSGSFL